jgi:hypothetical protein
MPRDAPGGRPAWYYRIQSLAQTKVGGINGKSRWNQLLKQTSDLLLGSAHIERFYELRASRSRTRKGS